MHARCEQGMPMDMGALRKLPAAATQRPRNARPCTGPAHLQQACKLQVRVQVLLKNLVRDGRQHIIGRDVQVLQALEAPHLLSS